MQEMCILALMQYWEEDEGGITDWAEGTAVTIFVLGKCNSPILTSNISDTF